MELVSHSHAHTDTHTWIPCMQLEENASARTHIPTQIRPLLIWQSSMNVSLLFAHVFSTICTYTPLSKNPYMSGEKRPEMFWCVKPVRSTFILARNMAFLRRFGFNGCSTPAHYRQIPQVSQYTPIYLGIGADITHPILHLLLDLLDFAIGVGMKTWVAETRRMQPALCSNDIITEPRQAKKL